MANEDAFIKDRLKRVLGSRYLVGDTQTTDEVRRNIAWLRLLVARGTIDQDTADMEVFTNQSSAIGQKSSYWNTISRLQFGANLTEEQLSRYSTEGTGLPGDAQGMTLGEVFGFMFPGKGSGTQSDVDAINALTTTPTPTSSPTTVTGTGTTGSRITNPELSGLGARTSGSGSTTTNQMGGTDPGPGPGTPGDGQADMPGHDGVFGIPAGGEVWKVDGKWAVAYQTEDGGPWIYYTVPDDDSLNTFFPNGVPKARTLTTKEANRLGAITPGSTFLLRGDGAFTEGWEEGFNATLDREALLRPWLDDPEVVAVYLAAALEGRTPTAADLESTEYFANRSDAEIDYVAFEARATEKELQQYHLQFKDTIRQQLIDAGVRNPPDTVVDFVSRKWASGQWSDAYASRQVLALSNPFSSVEMDADLQTMMKGQEFDTLRGQTEAVKAEVQRWLGPLHSKGFSDEWYRQWAGSIMDDPNAENDLRDFLQGQRLSLYPEYENANLTYEDISGVWAGTMQREWGVTPADDKEWQVLDRVIRANDAAKAGQILREEGINLGVEQVKRSAMEGFGANVGDQVVQSF